MKVIDSPRPLHRVSEHKEPDVWQEAELMFLHSSLHELMWRRQLMKVKPFISILFKVFSAPSSTCVSSSIEHRCALLTGITHLARYEPEKYSSASSVYAVKSSAYEFVLLLNAKWHFTIVCILSMFCILCHFIAHKNILFPPSDWQPVIFDIENVYY